MNDKCKDYGETKLARAEQSAHLPRESMQSMAGGAATIQLVRWIDVPIDGMFVARMSHLARLKTGGTNIIAYRRWVG